jgi:ribosomal-protein-alanine N-acetyltransferase
MMAPGETEGRGPQFSAIEFVRLSHIDTASLLRLVNDPRVQRHMPLAGDEMSAADVHAWVGDKERYWDEFGFGPWGIRIQGTVAGWGGLQPFNGDVEIALVLLPEFWGWGKAIFLRLEQYAFGELGLTHIVVALPRTRGGARGLLRLGFRPVDTADIEGHPFVVYRLDAPGSSG